MVGLPQLVQRRGPAPHRRQLGTSPFLLKNQGTSSIRRQVSVQIRPGNCLVDSLSSLRLTELPPPHLPLTSLPTLVHYRQPTHQLAHSSLVQSHPIPPQPCGGTLIRRSTIPGFQRMPRGPTSSPSRSTCSGPTPCSATLRSKGQPIACSSTSSFSSVTALLKSQQASHQPLCPRSGPRPRPLRALAPPG